jgi:hypothetical protein
MGAINTLPARPAIGVSPAHNGLRGRHRLEIQQCSSSALKAAKWPIREGHFIGFR